MTRRRAAAAALVSALCLLVAQAPRAQPEPEPLLGIGVDERLGEQLPLELVLEDAAGRARRLGDLLGAEGPTVLMLGYFHCRMLCGRVLEGLADALRTLERRDPRQLRGVRALAVSIDPRDGPGSAGRRQHEVLRALGWPAARWPFLVASEPVARALADGVGFRYRYDARTDQYAHPAVLFVLAPGGRVSGYLYGVAPDAGALGEALRAAREQRTRPSLERVLMRCFQYVPALRRFAGGIQSYYRLGGAAILLGVVGGLALLLRRERGRRAP